MSRKRIIMIGVVTFLVGTMLLFPARVAYHWFVPEQFKLNGISGSIWSGKASAGMVAGVYFTNLDWSFRPFSLLVGQLAFETSVNAAGGQISMTAGVGIGGTVSLSNMVASLSLADIHPALRANRIDGMVNIQMQRLVLNNGWPTEAEGSVGVGNLVAAAAGPVPLGNFQVEISTQDSGIVGLVKDAGAVLDVTGTLQLAEDRSYSLVGNVAPNRETPVALNNNLRFLGTPDQNGERQFRFEGSL